MKPDFESSAKTEGRGAGQSRGLGDDLARLTAMVGIKPCEGCKKRMAWLNGKFPRKTIHLPNSGSSSPAFVKPPSHEVRS